MFVITLKEDISDEIIKESISKIFELNKSKVSQIYEDSDESVITYEKRIFEEKIGYYIELCFFIPDNICLLSKIYNNLSFALLFVNYISDDIIIDDESDDPYQLIRITKNQEIFLVEREDSESESIIIKNSNQKKLNKEYALSLLQDKEYYLIDQDKRPAYYVKDSEFWLNKQ